MTKEQAIKWVRSHIDYDDPPEEVLVEAFTAIFGREPDRTKETERLRSHLWHLVTQEVTRDEPDPCIDRPTHACAACGATCDAHIEMCAACRAAYAAEPSAYEEIAS
jgi:hypothetical protein